MNLGYRVRVACGLDPDCRVHEHDVSSAMYSEFMTIARAAVLPQLLRKARDMAVNSFHLDPELLDAALNQKSTRPAPPDPVFHTFGKKLAAE